MSVTTDSEEINISTGPSQQIINIISVLDKGNGADVQEIIKNIKIQNSDQVISNLIS